MVLADWIAIAVIVVSAGLGALIGFGRGLKFFTSGIFGVIISVFLCYIFGGMILKLTFVQDLLGKFSALWTTKSGGFYNFLSKIRMEIIVYYIVLFIIAQILRIILVKILKHVFEAKFIVFKVINKVLGAVLFAGMIFLLGLFVFQIIHWVGGETELKLLMHFGEFKFVGWLYVNNPLNALVGLVKF